MGDSSQPSLSNGSVLAGTYRITRFIGRGGMGEVYEAAHGRLPGRYAIKLLLKEFAAIDDAVRRFKQEAEVTSALRHPNIVQVMDFAQMDDGTAFMAMEFLEGRDLAEELRVCGPLTMARTLEIATQVANGLAAAHAEGIVHRDLKPANIFLSPLRGTKREIAKIVDFGISKVRAANTGLTQTQTVIGTPQYMSPEQARGQTKFVDARTDQFAFASIVYEMLAGRPAFEGEGAASVLYQVVHEPAESLVSLGRSVSAEIDRVLARAMAKNAADRYDSVDSFITALSDTANGAPSAASSPQAFAPRATAFLPSSSEFTKPPTNKPISANNTLRDATGEMSEDAEADLFVTQRLGAQKKKFAVVGAVGAVVLIGIVAIVVSSRGTKPEVTAALTPEPAVQTSKAKPEPDAPKMPSRISVLVAHGPSDLVVTVDGVEAEIPLELEAGDRTHQVVFSAPGFVPQEHLLSGREDIVVELKMTPVAKVVPVRAKPASAAKGNPSRKRRNANAVTDI